MAYKSLQEALSCINESVKVVNGKEYRQFGAYLGRNTVTAQPKRMWAPTRDRLEADIRAFYKTLRKGGEIQAVLTAAQIDDARIALDIVRNAGMKLTLSECARMATEKVAASRCTKTVAECYAEYVAEKVGASSLEMKAVRARVGKWVEERGGMLLADVTPAMVVADIKRLCEGLSATTYNGRLEYTQTFFRWCMKKPRQWISESPLDGVVGKKTVWKEPDCIDVECMRKLLETVVARRDEMPAYGAYVAMSFFCGVRREEILRIAGKREKGEDPNEPAARINLDTRTFTILKPKGYLKGIRPRSFTIPDVAVEWMRFADFENSVKRINEHTVDRLYRDARAHGAKVPKNCGRHSFITYHVCAFEDMAKTLLVAGTGDVMAESHYRALRSHEEGLAYFGLTPSAISASAPRS